jgi:hypothetical protein
MMDDSCGSHSDQSSDSHSDRISGSHNDQFSDSRSLLRRAHGALRANGDGATTRRCDEITLGTSWVENRGGLRDRASLNDGHGNQSGDSRSLLRRADGALRASSDGATTRRGDGIRAGIHWFPEAPVTNDPVAHTWPTQQ